MKSCCDSSEQGEILKSETVDLDGVNRVEGFGSDSAESPADLRKKIIFLIGSGAVFLVVVLWTVSNYLTSEVLSNYKYPLILTVANNLSFLAYFIFLVIPDPMMECLKKEQVKEESSGSGESEKTENSADDAKLPPLTLKETAKIALVFFLLYFLSNFLLNFSLRDGDLASVSNLSSTSGFFTLLLGYFFGVEILSFLRISAVTLSVIATWLSVYVPGFSWSSDSTSAAAFALSSAFTYGVYSIYLKKVAKDESRISMPLLFAFVGLYTLITIVPIIFICHWAGFYVVEIPDRKTLTNILINTIVGALIPNYMWNIAFSLTTPLMVAIGLAFCTPLGVLAGWLKNDIITPQVIAASCIIIVSFCLLNLASLNQNLDQELDSYLISLLKLNHLRKRSKPL